MKRIQERTPIAYRPSGILHDPALWVWLFVVLLAILPARAALAGG
jgi:hypothetical protein